MKKEQQKNKIMQESYQKGLNILIQGIIENSRTNMEKREETYKHIHTFITSELQIKEIAIIAIADNHRLLQQAIYINNYKIHHPIILMLVYPSDKNIILKF